MIKYILADSSYIHGRTTSELVIYFIPLKSDPCLEKKLQKFGSVLVRSNVL